MCSDHPTQSRGSGSLLRNDSRHALITICVLELTAWPQMTMHDRVPFPKFALTCGRLAASKSQFPMDIVKDISQAINPANKLPPFKAGDTITVHYRIVEGDKSRVQPFKGVVLQRRGSGPTETMTIRKISNNVGVERIFPVQSPNIEKIEVNRRGRVRRARLFYLRERKGKRARIKENRKTD